MAIQNVTVSLPEDVYLRLEQVARGTKQSLSE
jgi:predicted transcriptional regulator